MDEYDDMDNNWGNKHSDYYAGRKLKDEDNFLEEEEEAIKLQQAKLKKLKEMNLLDSDQEEEKVTKTKTKGKTKKQTKKEENVFDLESSSSDLDVKKKKPKTKNLNKEEKEEISQILKNIKIHINEIEENARPIIDIIKSEKLDQKLTKTITFLKLKKNLHLLYTIYNLFYIHYKNQKKISDHHPVLKKMLMIKNELDGLKKNDQKIFEEIDNLLKTIDENKNQNEGLERNEEVEDDSEENEEFEQSSNQEEPEIEEEQKFLNKKRTNDFIQQTKNKVLELKEKKNQKLEKEKEKVKKEVENKNMLGQRLANENILKARGLYRKRKRYQGNAKLHLREKYYKKEKLRKNFVKEYTGKPEVYGGEVTGIRRDLIRSTKIN